MSRHVSEIFDGDWPLNDSADGAPGCTVTFMFVMADGTAFDAGQMRRRRDFKLDPASKTWTPVDSVVRMAIATMYQI